MKQNNHEEAAKKNRSAIEQMSAQTQSEEHKLQSTDPS